MTVGEYLRNHRISQGLTLREFCKQNGLDPRQWSKLERGVFFCRQTEKNLINNLPAILCREDGKSFSKEKLARLIEAIREDINDGSKV